jgi:hypothetical protein
MGCYAPPRSVPTTAMRTACRKRQNSLLVHSRGNSQQIPVRARQGQCTTLRAAVLADAPQARASTLCSVSPSESTTCDKWVARGRAACVGSATNCFTGGTISTIANHRQLASAAPRSPSCLESQPTAPSVRVMDMRGLVNPVREISVHQLPSAAARTQPSGVTSALSPCSSRTAICPRRYRRASRASRTFMLIIDLPRSV